VDFTLQRYTTNVFRYTIKCTNLYFVCTLQSAPQTTFRTHTGVNVYIKWQQEIVLKRKLLYEISII